MNHSPNRLKVRSLGIDTYREHIIFMHKDCPICISEGFKALTRLAVEFNNETIIATLDVVSSNLLDIDEVILSEMAMQKLGVKDGDYITISHLLPIDSLSDVRAKMYHKKIDEKGFRNIINDITRELYSDIELAAFVTATANDSLDLEEITWLTKAMVDAGSKLNWNKPMVMDKHCIGGLPGNRTTPIVVSIAAAAGLIIPKTSSRAITSPAGTADTMETMTTVALSIEEIREVVNKEGGCFAWGGAIKLSPADDILIAIERGLDIDSTGQMIASVLSKKAAAGSTHVLIDIPVGDTAKIRTQNEALKLQYYFNAIGNAIGLNVKVEITDGTQPVGRGIGPSLEAIDILAVLRNEKLAPDDLRERALLLAGGLLELSNLVGQGEGVAMATEILVSGKAYEKFMAICLAQGGFREPGLSKYRIEIKSEKAGTVKAVDNRRLAKIAKLAGAPLAPSAGVYFTSRVGTKVEIGQTLFTIHAEASGELEYALEYMKSTTPVITIE